MLSLTRESPRYVTASGNGVALPLPCLGLFGPVSLTNPVLHADCVPVGVGGGGRPNTVPALRERQTVLEYLSKWVSIIVRQGLKKDGGCQEDTAGRCD